MNDRFFDLKQEKQNRIINAALKVFSQNGYDRASTDDIVREGSISKGLLFHYFESKLNLFSFLFDYSVRFLTLEYSSRVDRRETDFFTLVRQMELAQMQVMKLHPYLRRFLDMALREDNRAAASQIRQRKEEYLECQRSYLAQADYRVFAPLADSGQMIRLVRYTVEGVTLDLTGRYDFTPEKLYREICRFLGLLEKAFLGEGGHEGETVHHTAE